MKPTIQSFDHLVLTVANVDATCAFYQRVLGFEVVVFRGGKKALTFGSQKITNMNWEMSLTRRQMCRRPVQLIFVS